MWRAFFGDNSFSFMQNYDELGRQRFVWRLTWVMEKLMPNFRSLYLIVLSKLMKLFLNKTTLLINHSQMKKTKDMKFWGTIPRVHICKFRENLLNGWFYVVLKSKCIKSAKISKIGNSYQTKWDRIIIFSGILLISKWVSKTKNMIFFISFWP